MIELECVSYRGRYKTWTLDSVLDYGLDYMDWTKDWIMDSILDLIGQWSVLALLFKAD